MYIYFIFLLDPKWPLQVLDIFYLTLMYSFNLNFITSLFFSTGQALNKPHANTLDSIIDFFLNAAGPKWTPLTLWILLLLFFLFFFCCQAQMDPLNTVNSIHSIQLRRELKCFSLMKFKTLLGSFFIIVV